MADEFIISDTGNFTLTGTYSVTTFGHMYDGAVLRTSSVTPFQTYAEFSATGLDVGDYRLSYWWGNNSQSEKCKVTVTDGNSANSHELIMLRNRQEYVYPISITPTSQYNSGNEWREFAVGVKCETGTLNFKVEPEPRMRYTGNWDIPTIGGKLIPSLDGDSDTDPTYTPTSSKSKPHPLSTN